MKITKRQLKAALTAAYEAGFDGGRVLQHSPTDAVKRIVKHEVKHAKMRKLKNVRKHWKQELVDFINDKSKKYDMPRDKHGYVNLMAQLAENNEIDASIYQKLKEQDDSNTLSDLLAEYDFEGMDSAQVYASLDPTSTTSDNNESNASKLNETPTKEDV